MRFVVVLVALVACADPSPAPPSSCWPIEESMPSGAVGLGYGGNGKWEPMPTSIQFQNGNQGGTFLVLDARIRDLAPGDPKNPFASGNPRTKFTVVLFDG